MPDRELLLELQRFFKQPAVSAARVKHKIARRTNRESCQQSRHFARRVMLTVTMPLVSRVRHGVSIRQTVSLLITPLRMCAAVELVASTTALYNLRGPGSAGIPACLF